MRAATRATLIVDFSSSDPDLKRMLEDISEYPAQSSCRHELEAALYGFLHDKAVRDAQMWKQIEQGQKVRKAQQLARKLKREAESGNSN